MCENRVLAQCGAAVISHCTECGAMYIWHHNLMLCFTASQFSSFHDFTKELDFEQRSFHFPDGVERVILCTPDQDINFVFTYDEWTNFNRTMSEAVYLQEVYKMIH